MADKITIAAGHFHFFHRIAALIAESKGYFSAEGIDNVDITATGEDELTMEALKAGKVDFILDVRPLLAFTENSKEEKVYIIGGMINGLLTNFHGAKGISGIGDLKGKRVGLVEAGGGRESLWVKDLLRRHGFDLQKDVTFVTNIGYPSLQNQGPRLDRGDYQAVLIVEQHSEQAVKTGYKRLAERSAEYPEYPDRVVAASEKMISQYPEIVKAFLKGLVRGYRFVKEEKNWKEVVKLVEAYKWERDMGWEGFDHSLLETQYQLIKYVPSDGSVSRKGLETVITQAKSLRLLPETFTLDQAIRLEFVEQAAAGINQKFGPAGYE